MRLSELASVLPSISTISSHDDSHDEALEHMRHCARCSARLSAERSLTAGLQALAREERGLEAAPSLKRELLEAFASQHQTAAHNVVRFPRRNDWPRWALAAAAMLFIALTVFVARQILTQAPAETSAGVIPATMLQPRDFKPGGSSTNQTKAAPSNPVVKTLGVPRVGNAIASLPRAKRSVRSLNPSQTKEMPTETASTGITMSEVAANEVKTDFVPLTYLNSATAMDSGIVVRVEVSREKLAALGLPLNLERADEKIKADIVLGDDGVPRAIRLVQ